jgi:hypothetical protein
MLVWTHIANSGDSRGYMLDVEMGASGRSFLSDTNYAGQSDDIQDSGFLLPLFPAIYIGVIYLLNNTNKHNKYASKWAYFLRFPTHPLILCRLCKMTIETPISALKQKQPLVPR